MDEDFEIGEGRLTGSGDEFVSINHSPAELEVALDIVTMASLRSALVYSRKRVMRLPTLSFTTIEDDPDIAPAFKVPAQLLVPV